MADSRSEDKKSTKMTSKFKVEKGDGPSPSSTVASRPPATAPTALTPGGTLTPTGVQQLVQGPDFMREMLNSPMMQNVLSNPDVFRTIIAESPEFHQVIQNNPEIGHILNDPDTIRQSMEMIRNPHQLQEMLRNDNQAIRNLLAAYGTSIIAIRFLLILADGKKVPAVLIVADKLTTTYDPTHINHFVAEIAKLSEKHKKSPFKKEFDKYEVLSALVHSRKKNEKVKIHDKLVVALGGANEALVEFNNLEQQKAITDEVELFPYKLARCYKGVSGKAIYAKNGQLFRMTFTRQDTESSSEDKIPEPVKENLTAIGYGDAKFCEYLAQFKNELVAKTEGEMRNFLIDAFERVFRSQTGPDYFMTSSFSGYISTTDEKIAPIKMNYDARELRQFSDALTKKNTLDEVIGKANALKGDAWNILHTELKFPSSETELTEMTKKRLEDEKARLEKERLEEGTE